MNRDEYHRLRRSRSTEDVSARLRKIWEGHKVRHIEHLWVNGLRVSSKLFPPGNYMMRVISVREKAVGVMLWDLEVLQAMDTNPHPH